MLLNAKIRELVVFIITGIVLLLAYHWVFSPYFPSANNNVGNDYAYFLPNLLDGYYWYLNNGPFTIPWFTPAFCGGIPAFPNPQNLFYSVPQWVSFAIDPLSAAYLAMLTFAALGFTGFYLLLRHCFNTTQAIALLAAALFMFNGFFAHRMLIGHLTFHSFMLTPVIALLLLHQSNSTLKTLFKISLAGLLFSYIIYSGSVHLVLPIILILLFIGILHGLLHGKQTSFWIRLSCAGILGIAVSAAKLSASLAFLSNFERADYKLPGAESIWGLLKLSFETLFLRPSGQTVEDVIINTQWNIAPQEFEYGITLIPLFMLLIAAIFYIRAGINRGLFRQPKTEQWLSLCALLLILLIPLVLNYYTPSWNELLKNTPIIRSNINLIRWLCIYIPVIILISALALDITSGIKKLRIYFSAIGIIAVVIINANYDRNYYANQQYNPTPITEAFNRAQASNQAVAIQQITAFKDQTGRIAMPKHRNDTMIKGASQLFCYEAMFGYRLENFPLKQMRPGPVQQVINGTFNIKNPACYVYGDSNNCQPGDHFQLSQQSQAAAFASYQSFEFKLPVWQRIANGVSLVVLGAIMLFFLAYIILLLWKSRAR